MESEKYKQYIAGCKTCSEEGLEEHVTILSAIIEKASPRDIKRVLHTFKAMGNNIRTKIVLLLLERDEICACEFVVVLGLSQPNISHHLNILEQAEIISNYSRGKWKYYAITELGKKVMDSLSED